MVLWEALDALSHQLELCYVDADMRVVVLLDDAVGADRTALIRAAVARSGADAVEVRSHCARDHGFHNDLNHDQSLLAAITEAADLIITTHDSGAAPLAGPGAMVLHLADCQPHAYAPHVNLRRRTNRLHDYFDQALSLELTDPHGTELHIALPNGVVTSDHGIVSQDCPVASFPGGWVRAVPASGSVQGDLVVMPGDTNLNANRVISSPVRLQIVDDHVSVIDGDNPDADVLRALFEYAGQPSAYGIAHMSVGLNPGRLPPAPFDERLLNTHLSRLLAGVITLAFGENLQADRLCDQVVTLALPGRSLRADGLPISTLGQLQGDFAPDVYEA